jgi:glycerol-3-phosphate dehydrogenase
VIAGSTDIPVDDPETALCEEDEVDYILDSIREVFPTINIDRSNIVFRYCGVRPLPRSDVSTPGQISRDHSCRLLPPADGIDFPIYSLIGGKWTTFRAFSEQVADRLLSALQKPRRIRSENLPIGGGKQQWISTIHAKTGHSKERLQILLDRYGTRADDVAVFITAGSDAALLNQPQYTQREIKFLVSHEQVIHLDDLILRRTVMGLLGHVNRPLLEELAEIVGAELDWSQEEIRVEIERASKILTARHGVNLGTEAPSPGRRSRAGLHR